MRRLPLLSALMIIAAAALAVMSGAGYAALPVLLPTEASTWTAETTGNSTLETLGGAVVQCERMKAEGSFASNSVLGPFHVTFEKNCKTTAPAELLNCTGTGDATGAILSLGTVHLVFDTLSPALGGAALFLLSPFEFKCGGGLVTIKVKGQVLCLITPVNKEVKESEASELKCEQSKGDPSEVKYWNNAGTLITLSGESELLASIGGGAFEMAGQLGVGHIVVKNPAKRIELMV